MHIISAAFLGISTNLDNLLIGFSYGLQGKRISVKANLLIGLISVAATYVFSLATSFCGHLGRLPNIIGGVAIILIGLWPFISKKNSDDEKITIRTGFNGMLILGVSLAINCIPISIGAGLTGISPIIAAVSVGLFSTIFVGAGNYSAMKTKKLPLNSRLLEILGGAMMIVLGIIEIFF